MELEKLEVIITANADLVEKNLSKVMPMVEKIMKSTGQSVERGTDKIDKSLDFSESVSRVEKQMQQILGAMTKQSKMMEQSAQSMGDNVGRNISNGFTKAKKSVGKDVDAMVNEISAKMGQARAKQADIAYKQAQRQGTIKNRDEKGTIKYDNQIATAQAQMTKYQESAKSLARQMRQEFEAIPSELKNIESAMMQNEGKINAYTARLKEMQAQRSELAENDGQATGRRSRRKISLPKLDESIMNQEAKINKLKQSSESLAETWNQLTGRLEQLAPALARVNQIMGEQARETDAASTGMRRFGRLTEGSRGTFSKLSNLPGKFGTMAQKGFNAASSSVSRFGRIFNTVSGNTNKGLARNSRGMFTLGVQMKMMFRTFVFYGLMFKGLQKMTEGLWSALKANSEFSDSLNQIQVNLLTAFYPIYEFVMPAINALMRVLAQATAYIAGFVATLFGTTYSAAKQGASGLYASIQAMNESGTAADKNKEKIKQMQRSLMGFDEINNLSTDNAEDEAKSEKPGINFSIPDPKIPDWVAKLANQAKSLWSQFFQPIQNAWNTQGKAVIEAWKYALLEIFELSKSIGNSFMEVWTNGSGERILTNLLKILTDIGLIVGNLANQFNKAWNEADAGTRIFQSLFDLFGIMVSSVKDMTGATVEWSQSLDFTPSLESIANLLESMKPLTRNVFDGLSWAYKNVFLPLASFVIEDALPAFFDLLSGAIIVLNSVIEALKPLFTWLWDNMLQPIAKWTGGVIIDVLSKLSDGLLAISDWIDKHQSVVEAFAIIVGSFATAWWLVNAAVGIWGIVSGIAAGTTAVFAGAMAILTSPITLVILAIGAVIAIGVYLWKNWDEISVKAKEIWGKISEGIGKFLETIGNYVSDFYNAGKDFIGGLLGGIGDSLASIGTWMKENIFNPIVGGFKSLFGIHSPSTVFAEFGSFLIDGLYEGIKGIISKPVELVGGLWSDMKTAVSDKTSEIWGKSKELWGKTGETIKSAAGGAGEWVSGKWRDISKGTTETWDNVKKWTSDKWMSAKQSVIDNAKLIFDNAKSRFADTDTETSKSFASVNKSITDKTVEANNNATKRMTEMRDNLRNRFADTLTSTKSNFDSIYSKINTQSTNASNQGSSAFRTMRSNMTDSLTGLQTKTKEIFDKITGWATDLPTNIAKGLTNGLNAIKNAASNIGNGMVGIIGKAMNGVIKGINWVLNKVGSKTELTEWSIPKYASGTGYHKGGLALVNDASGPNYQEAFRTPDGRTGLFPRQRNMVVNLPKGSSVLSGERTANMMRGLPAYKNGVGDWFKEKWEGAKEIASDVWSYAKDPSKLLDAAVSQFVNLKNTVQPTLDMAKGTVATTANGALNWITSKFNEGYSVHQASFASHDGSIDNQWGVFSYLKNIANQAIGKFGDGLRITSGYRSGDPYYHGRRQAIDIALPAYMNGSAKNKEIANWAFDSFSKQVAYVITNGQVRDRSGFSGTGSSGSWVRWPDNDHYDHVHINGLLSSADVASLDSSNASTGIRSFGSTVDRWRSVVSNALRMLGLSSTTNMNATMNQIRTESNGNPNAINLWDSNAMRGTPSKGLLQVIDPTFRTYARSPYNRNIYDPLSNILASMRYAISRYGSLSAAYRGVGYENGGLVTQDGLYRMGEGNKAEMVIPLERPQRAMDLISQAFDYMGIDWTDSSIVMPSVFESNDFTQPSTSIASSNSTRYKGAGVQQGMESMVNGIVMAIQTIGGTPQQAPNGDIIINVGGKEFGRIAVREINKYQEQLGYTELNI